MKEKALTTEKEVKKESATKAPAMGKRLLVPRMMLLICVAVMVLTLNFVIKNTIKFDTHPPTATESPNTVAVIQESMNNIMRSELIN